MNNEWNKAKADIQKNGKAVVSIFLLAALLVLGKTSFYTVEPDEEAIVIRFGKYIGTYPPGLHFKLPFNIDKAIRVKTKRVLQEEFGFRTANVNTRRTTYSSDRFDDESLILTGDLNVADVEWVVQYQISDPFKYLFQTSDPISNIRDVSESIMRRVVGDRLVTEVLTTGRVEIANQAEVLMQDVLDKYDMGVKIVSVKLQDVNPPEVVKKSFNEVNEAKQEQEKMINQAERAYNEVIFEANGKAEKVINQAEGFSQALINRAKGDASRFTQMLVEYRRAPSITKRRIYLETMEDIFKEMKDITIVDSRVKGLLPVFGKDLTGGQSGK
ncbi:MAG: FtsH protease activity modulator HflK [Oligoflexia bacterium]|nr:FtsH protease activity modulator HflK [Oligoflexia bacterium]